MTTMLRHKSSVMVGDELLAYKRNGLPADQSITAPWMQERHVQLSLHIVMSMANETQFSLPAN